MTADLREHQTRLDEINWQRRVSSEFFSALHVSFGAFAVVVVLWLGVWYAAGAVAIYVWAAAAERARWMAQVQLDQRERRWKDSLRLSTLPCPKRR